MPDALRATVIIAALVFMHAGPLLQTGLGQPLPRGLHAWRMYHNRGQEQCKLTTFVVEGGVERPVDWLEVLGKGPWYAAPRNYLEVESHDDAASLAKKMCPKLPRSAEVAAISRCVDRSSRAWVARRHDAVCGR